MRIYDRVFASAFLQCGAEASVESAHAKINQWSNLEFLANVAAALQQELAKYELDDAYEER